jgi:hypothetical protein
MSALVNALDNYCPQQLGEKGSTEYGWSFSLQEKITQFSFQLTRTNEDGIESLREILNNMLTTLKYQIEKGSLPEKQVAKGTLSILYRMIGQTRDIVDGKGECALTYMMIHEWHNFFPNLAFFALRCLVILDKGTDKGTGLHPYGSWKDLKYFSKYCRSQDATLTHPLILETIRIMNTQLHCDAASSREPTLISLAAKWVPREKSSFGWLYESLATNYFSEYMKTADTYEKKTKAVLKCKMMYRKLISSLNKTLDTLQIKQCDNRWSEIDFNRVTSVSLSKQKKAFANVDKKGKERYDLEDRHECAEHFNDHVQKGTTGEVSIKGKRISMTDFTKQALEKMSQTEVDLLNMQWNDSSTQTGALTNMIPMVDVSGSMEGDPMNAAIALGIRIAEKSSLGNRIMTFSANPKWVNLEPIQDKGFVAKVRVVKGSEWGYNTNFYKALNLILDTIVENKFAPEVVEDMTLVILSDMQIDDADADENKLKYVFNKKAKKEDGIQKREALYETIRSKYEEAGMRVHGKPYKTPHILFWNLRSTSGFPTLSNEKNVSMMAGFSPALLNVFCETGIASLQSCSPWIMLKASLDNKRYDCMSDYLDQEIQI